jgi:hypothetical protein
LKNGHLSVPTLRVLKKIQILLPRFKTHKKFAPREKMNAHEALREANASPSIENFAVAMLVRRCRVSKLAGLGALP